MIIEVSDTVQNIINFILVIGYPLIGWCAYKAGFSDGISHTLNFLDEEGLMEFDPEETDES